MLCLIMKNKTQSTAFLDYIWKYSSHYPEEATSVKFAYAFDTLTGSIPHSIKWIKKDKGGVLYLYPSNYNNGDELKKIYPHYTISLDDNSKIHYTSIENGKPISLYDINKIQDKNVIKWLSGFFTSEECTTTVNYFNKYMKYKTKYINLYNLYKLQNVT